MGRLLLSDVRLFHAKRRPSRRMGAVFSSEDRAGHSNRSRVCIVCSQKPTYARYTRTQLRKRLHTMHTKTRIGVSVGLRVRKCMHTEMHTERIRNAYKHIKREKERILLLLSFYIVCLYIFYCSRFQAIILNCSRFQACTDPIEPSETSIKPHCLFFFGSGSLPRFSSLYALYAVKNQPMHAIQEHNSGKDCIQCIQEESLA